MDRRARSTRSPGLGSPRCARSPAVSIRWHDSGVPSQSSSRTASRSRDPGSQAAQQAEHAVRGLAGGPFERGQLLDLVDDAQAVAGVDQQVGGVLDETCRSDTVAERVDEERRSLDRRALRVGLPADDADPGPWVEPLVRQDLAERLGSDRVAARTGSGPGSVRGASAAARRPPVRSTRCRPGSPDRRPARRGARLPRSVGRSRSGRQGWRCARGLRRRRSGRSRRASIRSRRRSSRAA